MIRTLGRVFLWRDEVKILTFNFLTLKCIFQSFECQKIKIPSHGGMCRFERKLDKNFGERSSYMNDPDLRQELRYSLKKRRQQKDSRWMTLK